MLKKRFITLIIVIKNKAIMSKKEDFRNRLIEESVKMYESKASKEEIKTYLKNEGASIYDIDYVLIQTKRKFFNNYKPKINEFLLEGKDDEYIIDNLLDEKVSSETLIEIIEAEKDTIKMLTIDYVV